MRDEDVRLRRVLLQLELRDLREDRGDVPGDRLRERIS
jgi:hypothetical protein